MKSPHHLEAAIGYLELGMAREAGQSLDLIPPGSDQLTDVLSVRLSVCHALHRWNAMECAAQTLCALEPGVSMWFISLAYASCRLHGPSVARRKLIQVLPRFQRCALLRFNLARYDAAVGRLGAARRHLAAAMMLDPVFWALALRCGELAPMHDQLRRAAGTLTIPARWKIQV